MNNDNVNLQNEIEENTVEMDSVEEQDAEEIVLSEEEILQEKLAKAEQDILLLHADMQNLRRRTEKELSEAKKYGVSPLARDLFLVSENLRMALMAIPEVDRQENQALKNLLFGLEMVSTEFDSAFKKNGIDIILPSVGDDFNYDVHQAMAEIESEDVELGKICQVLQAGYMLHDRLLKPAMVNIVKAK